MEKETENHESKALGEEEKVRSEWYVMNEEGDLIELSKFDFSGHDNLKKFADYEVSKVRAYATEPPHIKLMQKLQLVDYEPGSDSGNFRYYPNGRLIKSLLENFVTGEVINYGAVELETPIMYDYENPALAAYLDRFPARHYTLTSDDKKFFLRFSGDFGQFLLIKDAIISYKQLPFKFYEITHYSFRREKSGELAGLKRLRTFTMPDMHTLCSDIDQAKEEFKRQFQLCISVLQKIGISQDFYEAAIRFTKDFWNENQKFIIDVVKAYKKPVLIEMWSFRYAYFDPKFEFNFIDALGKASAISTVQIDHENGERYGITYVNKDGKREHPVLLHDSPSGAIERVIYALLEIAYMSNQTLPFWLSPTQLRLIPVSNKHLEKCLSISKKLESIGARVDIDDTNNTINKKIRNAEIEWIPYVIVIGDNELESEKLVVRVRENKKQETYTLEGIIKKVLEEQSEMPRAKLSVSKLLSNRPLFK